MRNSGFLKNRTNALKGHSFIETNHGNLSVEIDLLRAMVFCYRDDSLQKPRSDAPPAIAFQHGHAPYLRAPSMHYHPGRSHGLPRLENEKMKRAFLVVIQLNLWWDTLLFYEDACANGINFL
jgi:hypothetical protein